MDTPDVEIGKLEKNDREAVVVALRTYKGHRFCDVRIQAKCHDGSVVITGKGVTVKLADISSFITLLNEARSKALAEIGVKPHA